MISFHLRNNEVGSEAIGSVCLPPNCAYFLMDSVQDYFSDPGLSQRPQLQKDRARSMSACVCLSDSGGTVLTEIAFI